jgi:hypothetical protein
MDFSRPDAADAQELNAILWQNALHDMQIRAH